MLAGALAAAVTAASTVKYDYSALKLTVTDVPLMFAGTARFFVSQYPRAVLAVLTGTAAFILAVIATLIHGTGPSMTERPTQPLRAHTDEVVERTSVVMRGEKKDKVAT